MLVMLIIIFLNILAKMDIQILDLINKLQVYFKM